MRTRWTTLVMLSVLVVGAACTDDGAEGEVTDADVVGGGEVLPTEQPAGGGTAGDPSSTSAVAREVERLVAAGELCDGDGPSSASSFEEVTVPAGRIVAVGCEVQGEVTGTDLLLLGDALSTPLLAYGWNGTVPVLAATYAGEVQVTPGGGVVAVVEEGVGCGWRLSVVDIGTGELRPAEVRAQPCPGDGGTTPEAWAVAWTNEDL